MSHPVTLLPWYQNGTLSEAERADVAAHLQTCAECQAELDSLRAVRSQMHEALESDSRPGAAARRRVMQNVRPQPQASGFSIGEVLRNLFAPKWVPAAALSLIAVQGALLVWSLGEPPMQTAMPPAQTVTQPLPGTERPRALGMRTEKLRVQFSPTATEADMRALLMELSGAIVGGPLPTGDYIIEVTAGNTAQAEDKVARMLARTEIVRAAQREPPPP